MKLPNYPSRIRAYLEEKVKGWSQNQDISGKIDHLNQLANDNPKHTAALTFSFLCLCVIIAFGLSFLPSKEELSPFTEIEDISPILQGKQQIEEMKQQQTNGVKSFILQGQLLKKDLDSLVALPHKSHIDSIEILRKHKQLEIIVRHLNEKD